MSEAPRFEREGLVLGAGTVLLTVPQIRSSITDDFLTQSANQIAASGGRPIVWIFAEEEAAIFVRGLFGAADQGRERITVGYVPWTK